MVRAQVSNRVRRMMPTAIGVVLAGVPLVVLFRSTHPEDSWARTVIFVAIITACILFGHWVGRTIRRSR